MSPESIVITGAKKVGWKRHVLPNIYFNYCYTQLVPADKTVWFKSATNNSKCFSQLQHYSIEHWLLSSNLLDAAANHNFLLWHVQRESDTLVILS